MDHAAISRMAVNSGKIKIQKFVKEGILHLRQDFSWIQEGRGHSVDSGN